MFANKENKFCKVFALFSQFSFLSLKKIYFNSKQSDSLHLLGITNKETELTIKIPSKAGQPNQYYIVGLKYFLKMEFDVIKLNDVMKWEY